MKIQFLNVVTTSEGIYEYEGDTALLFVPKKEIENIDFGLAPATRWPLLALAIGIVLICAGVFLGVVPLVENIISPNPPGFPILKGYAFMALDLVPGLYFSVISLKKKNCLFLQTKKGIQKFILRGTIDRSRLNEFIKESLSMMKNAI